MEIEMLIFMRYKVNPYEMEKSMTMLDLQSFITTLSKKIEEEQKNQSKDGNKLMKSLIAIRDILNYMTLNEHAIR